MSDASAGASLKLAFRIMGATSAGASVFRTVVPQTRQQLFENCRDRFIDGLFVCAHHDFRVVRRFVGRVNSGEFTNLTSSRFFVEIFGVRSEERRVGSE